MSQKVTTGDHASISAILSQVGVDTSDFVTDDSIGKQALETQETLEERRQKALELGVDPSQPLTGHEKAPKEDRPVDQITDETGIVIAMQMYDVTVDGIIGNNPSPLSGNVGMLSGRVSDADLAAAGVDKEFLLRVGSIVPAGYQKTK